MPDLFRDDQQSGPADKLRLVDGADPLYTVRQYRFLPPNRLAELSATWDHGLDHLLYVQSLVDED